MRDKAGGVQLAARAAPASSGGTLHLHSIAGAFDPERDVALGPQCFLGRAAEFPGWRDLPYVEPFRDDDEMERTYVAVVRLCNHRMTQLAAELNSQHGTTYSTDFWRLIAMPWLMELVQRLWVQHERIRSLAARHGSRPLRAKVWLDDVEWRFEDVEQFQESLLREASFNWWLDSHVLATIRPAGWVLDADGERPGPRPSAASPLKPHERSGWRGWARRAKMRWGLTDIYGARWATLCLGLYINVLPRGRSTYRIHPADDGFRPEEFFPQAFLDLLDRMIERTLPLSYGARFDDYARFAKSLPMRPGRLRLGVIDLWNDMEKVVAAYAHEGGEKLVVPQHGGFYALLRWHIHAEELEGRNGALVTWGWTHYRGMTTRLVPLPAPLPSRVAGKHCFRDRRLILVGSVIRFRMMRIAVEPWGSSWLEYCRSAVRFLDSLAPAVRAATWFRPYMNTATDLKHEYVTEVFPDMPLLTGDLHAAMVRCRMLVTTGPDTTTHLALAANVPTVVFWEPQFFKLAEQALPYFDKLKRAGIYFDDPNAAARHVSSVWDTVEDWWMDPQTQDARRTWTDHYARSHRLWALHWLRPLARLSREEWR